MSTKKIEIELDNGYKLVAETGTDSNYPAEIYVGIETLDGSLRYLSTEFDLNVDIGEQVYGFAWYNRQKEARHEKEVEQSSNNGSY